MRIIFMASGAFAVPTLRWLHESEHEVALVVTQPARGSGRGRKITPTPVAVMARELSMPVLETENVNTPEMLDRLKACDARLGLAIAFGQKLGDKLLGTLPDGCINLHASLLPKYRGAAPINWAIVHGEEKTGCTVFRIVERMDAGPILSSKWTYIKPEETTGQLHDRLAGIGVDAVDSALKLFDDGQNPTGTPQDDALASKAPKLKKDDGLISFDRPVFDVLNHICGMTPWPGARATFHGGVGQDEVVTIVSARPCDLPGKPTHRPGTLDGRLYVAATDGFIEILEIKPAGSRTMSWPEFVNGRHVKAGDGFLP